MLLLLHTAALAAGLSGLGVPEPLGAFGGPTASGALGLASNPASARPESLETALDLGLMRTAFVWQLDGAAPESSGGITPIPSLAVGAPTGPLGVGLAVFVPYARSGSGPGADSPSRFHSGTTTVQVVEADLSVAAELQPGLTLGGALRLGQAQIATEIAYDSALPLNEALGADGDIPYGDPLFEGTETYSVRGAAIGGAAGLRWRGSRGSGVDLVWRSPLIAHLSGPLSLRPSNDLALVAEGRADVRLTYPMEILAAATFRRDPWRVGGELGYTAWSSLSRLETTLSELEISADDPLFQEILDSYGLSEAEFLASLDSVVFESGLSDILSGGAWVDRLGAGWQVRAGAWITPAAIPDAYLHPGNADFGTLDLRLAGGYAVGRVVLGLSGDLFLSQPRLSAASVYAFENGSASGVALPDATGTYQLGAARVGLTVAWRAVATEGPGLW